MKKKMHPIDDFFLKALEDHAIKPSGNARQKFLNEAASATFKSPIYNRWYFYPLVILLFIGGITGLYFGIVPSNSGGKLSSVQKINHGSPFKSYSFPLDNPKQNNDIATHPQDGQKVAVHHSSQTIDPGKSSIQKIAAIPLPDENQTNFKLNDTTIYVTEKITENTPYKLSGIISPVKSANNPSEQPVMKQKTTDSILNRDTIRQQPESIIIKELQASRSARTWQSFTGAYYACEWMFNTLEGEKNVNNFGFEETFYFGRYSVRTGIGLSITKGTNELSISYKDYLGSYNHLDSMEFRWNANHTQMVPVFYLSRQNVWDSLVKLGYQRVIKRYTYLQIPLIIGYDFPVNSLFTLGLRTGPILSLLVNTRQLTANYDPGLNKIVLTNLITPERMNMNWQFMAGASAIIRISHRMSFEIEPNIRYYFDSVYEKWETTRKPWSVGLRLALMIRN